MDRRKKLKLAKMAGLALVKIIALGVAAYLERMVDESEAEQPQIIVIRGEVVED
jgi:hypothetical protein